MLIRSIQMCTIVLFLLSISWEIFSLILYVLSDYFFHVAIINFHAISRDCCQQICQAESISTVHLSRMRLSECVNLFQRSWATVPVYVWVNIEVGVPPGGLAVWHCCAAHSSFQTTSTEITTAVTDIYSTASRILTNHVTKPQTHIFISCCDLWKYFIYMFSYIHGNMPVCYFSFLVQLEFENHIAARCSD